MTKGPKGERRPADVIGAAILVGRIATGEAKDKHARPQTESKAARLAGLRGPAFSQFYGQRSGVTVYALFDLLSNVLLNPIFKKILILRSIPSDLARLL